MIVLIRGPPLLHVFLDGAAAYGVFSPKTAALDAAGRVEMAGWRSACPAVLSWRKNLAMVMYNTRRGPVNATQNGE